MTEKKCSRCKKTKGRMEFGQNLSMPDGLNYWCRQCLNAHRSKSQAGKKLVLTASALGISLSAKLAEAEAGDTKHGT